MPVSLPDEEGVLEVHGLYFFYDGDDVWLWSEKADAWAVLPEMPPYLVIVRERLAVIDVKTGRAKCNCPRFEVVNFGCKCGGI